MQPGQSLTRSLLLSNSGAGASPFALTELPASAGSILQAAAETAPNARQAPQQVGRTEPVRLENPEAALITEGFEGTVPPTGWLEVINNAGYNWGVGTTSPHGGAQYADIVYDPAPANQNEWLLTPELSLSSGTLSFWSFGSVYWCKTTYDNCDLNVWIVVGNVGGGDDILVGKGDTAWTANWTYAQSTFNLTPLLPGGPVRIGFQYIGNDGAEVALDDVLLDGAEGFDIPWLAEQPVTGTLSADNAVPVEVTFTAAPTMTYGTYRATLRLQTNDQINPAVNIPVTMTLTAPPAQLTVNVVGNGTVGQNPPPSYVVGQVVTLTATPATGWSFAGWSGALSGTTSPITITLTSDKVVTATFTANPVNLTVNVVGGGTVTPVPASPYLYGAVVTLTANAEPNWAFSGWSGDLTGTTNPIAITLTGDKVVTATFVSTCVPVSGADFTYTPTAPKVDKIVTFNGTALTGTTPITYQLELW